MQSTRKHPMILRRIGFQRNFSKTPSFKNLAAQHLLTQYLSLKNLHHFDENGRKDSIDYLSKSNPEIWNTGLLNEIGRLVQGIRDFKGNDAVEFISITGVPKNKKVAYANMIYDHILLKTENIVYN